MNQLDFTALIFNEGEFTCFGRNKYATHVYDAHTLQFFNMQYFVINPLHPTIDVEGKSATGRRADANVMAYRNILVEMDKVPLNKQHELIKTLGMPYSTRLFSGGKSEHFIISLQESLNSKPEYVELAQRIYTALGGEDVIDDGNSNPSRFSRFPNATNEKTGNLQKLLEVKHRVPNLAVENWLQSLGVYKLPKKEYSPSIQPHKGWVGLPNKFTRYFAMFGPPSVGRHKTLLTAACDYARCNYPIERAISDFRQASLESGITEKEFLRHIKNAYYMVKLQLNADNT